VKRFYFSVILFLIFGFSFVKCSANSNLFFGEIINSSNFPYLISIQSKEAAGEEIILHDFDKTYAYMIIV
jgi:hypothetical protein